MEGPEGSSPGRSLVSVAIATLVVSSAVVGVVPFSVDVVRAANTSTIEGTPHMNASAPDGQLDPGQNGAVAISLTNDATYDDNGETHPTEARDRAGEARSVSVNISDTRNAPLTVETGEQSVGTIQDGETGGPYSFNVVVDEDAEAGTYEMEVRTEYRHAESVTYEEVADGEYAYNESVVTRTETDTITVEIQPQARFEVTGVSHDVPLGGDGTVALTVTNTGDEDVTESSVSVTSSDSDFYFGSGTATSEANVGGWGPGETKTLRFRAGTVEEAVDREYPIDVSVSYTDSDDTQQTDSESIGIRPESRTRFTVESVEHDVPIGGEGTMTIGVEHTAGKRIEDVQVTASTTATDVYLGSESSRSTSTFVEAWEDGDRTRFTFRVGTTDGALNRSYPIELSFEYTDDDDNDNARTAFVEFSPEDRERFDVSIAEHDVPQDGDGTMTLAIENTGPAQVEDVTVTTASGDSTVSVGGESSQSSTVLRREWAEGERRNVTLRVRTADSAIERAYPLDVTFDYTDEADNDNSETEHLEFVPADRAVFAVANVSHDVPLDGEGTLSVRATQTVGKNLEDVTVRASSPATDMNVGSETTVVGSWRAGETRMLTFRVGTGEAALDRAYPIDLEFAYTDRQDSDNTRTKQVRIVPRSEADFSIEALEHSVPRDGVGTVTVLAENTAGKNLSEITVTASTSDSEIYVGSESSRSGTATVERWSADQTRELTFRVGATTNAVNRSYPLDLQFEYTDEADNDNQWTTEVEFRPDLEPSFVVESIDHGIPVGSTGAVTFTLRNDGPVNASDAVVTASAGDDAMFFGTGGAEPVEVQGVTLEPPQTGTPTAQTYVGDWPVGETRTVSLRAGFDGDAIVREYAATLSIAYENEDGDDMPDRTQSVGLEPLPEQGFSFERLQSDLHVGEEGNLRIEVTNTDDRPVDGVVVTAATQDQNVQFYNTRYAVGSLAAGESATVRYRVGVTEEAEHGPRVFELSARYRDPGEDVRQTDSRDVTVDIGADRDAFALETADGTFAPGESGPLKVTIVNRRDETLSNIQAKLFTDDPLDSADDSAFVPALDPGESTTITLDLSVGSGASAKTYSASMDFRFDDERGESELSDTYRVPVVVERSESSLGLPVIVGLIGVIVVLALAGWRLGAIDRLRGLVGTIGRSSGQ